MSAEPTPAEPIAYLLLETEIGPHHSPAELREHLAELQRLEVEYRDNPYDQPREAIAHHLALYRRWLWEALRREWLHRPEIGMECWPFYGSRGG